MAVQRRMQTANAAARGESNRPRATSARVAPSPRRSEEVRGGGHISTSLSKKRDVLHEASKEIDILHETFEDNEHPAFVKMSAGMTINLGNFESLRVDCSVTLPCHPQNIAKAYEVASDFVADRIAEEQADWLGEGNQKKKGR